MMISNILNRINFSSSVISGKKASPAFKSLPKDTVSFSNRISIADIQFHKTDGGCTPIGFSKDYLRIKDRIFVEYRPQREVKIGKRIRVVPESPAHYLEIYEFLPHYHIDKLISTGPGSGTNAVRMVVEMSKNDPITSGRVTVDANCIDGKTAPGGFYYKLGFRFTQDDLNKECEQWLKNGGEREKAPFVTGMMYLPKENIEHCLSYK